MATTTLPDLIKIVCNSVGASPFVLGAAVSGFRGVEGLADGATYSYTVQQGALWEYGRGVYSLSPGTLTRGVIKSSNANAAVPFSANAQIAFVLLAEDINERVGIPAEFTIGGVTSGPTPSVSISGTSPNFVLDFVLEPGIDGETPTLAVGTVTMTDPNTNATAAIVGTGPNYLVNFTFPLTGATISGAVIYNNTTIGLANTTTAAGANYFYIPSASSNGSLDLYRHDAGPVATFITTISNETYVNTLRAYIDSLMQLLTDATDDQGDPLPPYYLADPTSGYLLAWISTAGKLMSARNGGDEVATRIDVEAATALGALIQIVPDAVDENGDPLPQIYAVDPNTGYLLWWINEAGVVETGADATPEGPVIVSFDVATGILECSIASPKQGATSYITYRWQKSTASLSLGFWFFKEVYQTTRNGFTFTNVTMLLGAGASGFGVWSEGTYGASITASTTDGNPTINVTAVASGTIKVGQLITGTGIQANTIISAFGTGTGGTGTYTLSLNANATGSAALTTNGTSVDDPNQVAYLANGRNFFGLPAHGNGYPTIYTPAESVAAPIVFFDGLPASFASSFAFTCNAMRFQQAFKVYRSRLPALNPAIDAPTVIVYEDYHLNAQDQLRHEALGVYQEQFTMAGCYWPLLCTTDIFDRQQRDAADGLTNFQDIIMPTQYDNGTVAHNVPGITRVTYSSADGHYCDVQVSEPKMWASGNRPYGAVIFPGADSFDTKTSDPGLFKLYWNVGPTPATYSGVPSLTRSYAGERWQRHYTIKFITP